MVSSNQNGLVTGLNVIPGFTAITSNDYLPQITDGTEVVTCTITPKYATSKLWVEYIGNLNRDDFPATSLGQTALFRDAGPNALACSVVILGYYYEQFMCYLDTAGSTAATTYSIRVGPPVPAQSDECTNGKPGYPYMGGTMFCRLNIYEIGA